jgi:archaemetzincin
VRPFLLLSFILPACVCGKHPPPPTNAEAPVHAAEASEKLFARLLPLQRPLAPAEPGNWVSQHTEQPQSFWQYVQSGPVRATASRGVIYVLPLGDFTVEQRAAVESAQLFLAAFYQLPVKALPAVTGSEIPADARRKNPATGLLQLHTNWVLETLLPPRRPTDAVALLAFTPEDLYPDPAWNFVFGQASLTERVGVWSINRFGDPVKDKLEFTRRTLKVASHETAHMLGLQHCLFHACLMNGSYSLPESDAQPLELCPVCLRKLQWNVGFDVRARFQGLSDFHRIAGLEAEGAFIAKSLKALDAP